MKTFEFKSQVATTREQSQKLLQLGLKESTADCHWFYHLPTETWRIEAQPYFGLGTYRPAWSLHRLIEMYTERYLACSVNLKIFTYEWLINEIEIHIKEGDFNKDYLEEKK